MFEGSKSLLSLLIGASLIILGIIPLLNLLGIIGFGLPEFPQVLLQLFLGISGFYLIIDGFMVITMHPVLTITDILVGLAVASMGMLPLVNNLTGMIISLTFLNGIIVYICFALAGILLIINSVNF